MNASVRPSGEKRAWRSVRAPIVSWRGSAHAVDRDEPDRRGGSRPADGAALDREGDRAAVRGTGGGRWGRRGGRGRRGVRVGARGPPGGAAGPARDGRARAGGASLSPASPDEGLPSGRDGRAALPPARAGAPAPRRRRADVADAARRTPFDSSDYLFEPTWGGHRALAFVGPGRAAGRGRRPAGGPDGPRPRRRGCRSSPGWRCGSRRGPRSSTASSSWSMRRAARTTTRCAARLAGGPGRPGRVPRVRPAPPRRPVAPAAAAREAARGPAAGARGRATRWSWCPAIAGEGRALHDAVVGPGDRRASSRAARDVALPAGRAQPLWRSIPAAAPARRRRGCGGRPGAARPTRRRAGERHRAGPRAVPPAARSTTSRGGAAGAPSRGPRAGTCGSSGGWPYSRTPAR